MSGIQLSLTHLKPCHSFPQGTIYDSRTGTTERWYKPQWWDEVNFVPKSSGQLPEAVTADVMREKRGKIEIDKSTLRKLKESLERAVEKQLMSEVPYGRRDWR